MKLQKQLFLTFSIAAVVPLLVLWFLLGDILYKQQVAGVESRHLLIARNLGAALRRYHTDVAASFDLVSRNLVAGHEISDTNTFITQFNFRHFCVVDIQTGKVVAQAAPKAIPCPEIVPAKRFTIFKKLANHGNAVFTPIMAGPNNLSLIFTLRKFGNKLAIGAITTDYFVSIGSAVSFGKKGHAAIVDQVGNILAHPNPAWVKARKNISKIPIIKRMLAGETGVETFYSPALKADMIAGFTNIKGTGWSVMVPQPVSELKVAAQAAHFAIFPIIAICILLAGLVALIIARVIMKPLNDVIEATSAVENGDRHVTVDVDDSWHIPHEFRAMQERFNAMTKAVDKHQDNQTKERQTAENDSKNKTEYFANLAHELKTPLNSILGFSSVLRQAAPGSLKPHERSEFLEHIEKSAGHLLSFVNDLLNLNRLDMGAHRLDEKDFYLIDPIRFCETTLRKKIEAKNITMQIECEDKEVKLFADERSINQILINLVGNAVRYSFDKGLIKIITNLEPDGSLTIKVQDNGIGIPNEDLEEILLPFKRSNDPQLAEIHGTGLGLSIVSKLAQLHDMDFSIESEHGFSTTAILTIPKNRVINKQQSSQVA